MAQHSQLRSKELRFESHECADAWSVTWPAERASERVTSGSREASFCKQREVVQTVEGFANEEDEIFWPEPRRGGALRRDINLARFIYGYTSGTF